MTPAGRACFTPLEAYADGFYLNQLNLHLFGEND
jgi:hypothetical protein